MKVNQTGTSPAQGSEISSAKRGGKAASAQEAKRVDKGSTSDVEKSSSHSVNAEISPKSRELAQAKSIATQAPDVREDRIADLKRRISEGSYHVDADAIADHMVDDHIRMSGLS